MSVIVSVQRYGQEQVYDLDVSADVPAGELAENIAIAFGWKQEGIFFDLEVEATGTILAASDSLSQVNAWDGSHLILIQRGEQAVRAPGQKRPEPQKASSPPASRPVAKKHIQPDSPPVRSSDKASSPVQKTVEPPVSPMRGWKKLDLPATQAAEQEEQIPKAESKFNWKRIDED